MTLDRPLVYQTQNKETFFDVGKAKVHVEYSVQERKRWGIIPQSPIVGVQVRFPDFNGISQRQYELPRGFAVGEEYDSIEERLYGLTEESIRSFQTNSRQEALEDAVTRLEDDYLSPKLAQIRRKAIGDDDQKLTTDEKQLDVLTNRLLTAVQYTTGVTTLSRQGFEDYLTGNGTTSLVPVEVEGGADVISALRTLLDSHYKHGGNPEQVVDRANKYLVSHQEAFGVDNKARKLILENFVVPYIQHRNELALAFPDDVFDHAVDSLIQGGLAGFAGVELIVEPVLNKVFGVSADLPGFYLGAGITFVLPYLSGAVTAGKHLLLGERSLDSLEDKTRKLLPPPKK